MNLEQFGNLLIISLSNIFKMNKMTAEKEIPLEKGLVYSEIDAAQKIVIENAELNKQYAYIRTTKENRIYPLTFTGKTNLLKIYEVNYFSGYNAWMLKKIYKEDIRGAKLVADTDVNPTFYEDYSARGNILVYPSPHYDNEIIEIFGLFETPTVSAGTDEIIVPAKLFNTFRNYLIAKIQLYAGIVDQANMSTIQMLDLLENKLVKESIKYRREIDFYNPDKEEFVEGSM